MKALLILLLGSIVLAGCASTSSQMSAEDRALWDTNDRTSSAATR